jgi:hypothetical protein
VSAEVSAEAPVAAPAEAPAEAPAVAPAETHEPSASELGAPADPAAPEAEPDEGTPSFAVPDGIPPAEPDPVSSVNGHTASAPQQPQREVEPINLLESAGPAVAKRIAPVAVALVIVLAAVRRRRGKRA